MMQDLSENGRSIVGEIAKRHGVGADAAEHLLRALMAGHGNQAQFSHPDLGGMGQWSRGGMTMIGDMFNTELKSRVDSLASELSGLLARADGLLEPATSQAQSQSRSGGIDRGRERSEVFAADSGSRSQWWPEGLGQPGSTGAQNDTRYAFFPHTRRLAIDLGGDVTVYDTADHQIGGFSQAQGGGQSMRFDSQHGPVRLEDLAVIGHPAEDPDEDAVRPARPPVGGSDFPASEAAEKLDARSDGLAPAEESDVLRNIERLSTLHQKGILTDREYESKKAELLARL